MVFLLADPGLLTPWGDPVAGQELLTEEKTGPENEFGWLISAVNEVPVPVETSGRGFPVFGPVFEARYWSFALNAFLLFLREKKGYKDEKKAQISIPWRRRW